MTKLQAAMKDASAKGWRERKLYYRVGSYFKGCEKCGVTDVVNRKKVWLSGTDVRRAYFPKAMGWSYKCFDCQATDHACWTDTRGEIGFEPRILPKSDLAAESRREKGSGNPQAEYRKAAKAFLMPKDRAPQQAVLSARDVEIMSLEKRLAELVAMLKK